MTEKKIKRWRVKGTNDDGWVPGDKQLSEFGIWLVYGHTEKILPLAAAEIEYIEEPDQESVFDERGWCGQTLCPHGDFNDHSSVFCTKYQVIYGMHHFCPDAVVLKSEVE